MFKKKKTAPQNEQNKSAEKAKAKLPSGGFGPFLGQLLLAILLMTALAAGAIYFLQTQQSDAALVRGAKDTAQAIAGRIADFARSYQDLASRRLQSSELGEMLRQNDSEGLREEALAFKRLLPEGGSVRFFPLEWDQTDERSTPPVSFASLDLLRKVEKSGAPSSMEVHQFNTSSQHLAFALPVGVSGRFSGSALVTLPFELLSEKISAVDSRAAFQLQQMVAERPVPVVTVGSATGGDMLDGIAVPQTIWRLAYASGQAGLSEATLIDMIIVVAAGLLLGVIVVLLHQNLKKRYQDDLVTLFGLVEGISQGRGPAVPKALTAEMQGAFNLVSQLGQVVGRKLKGAPATDIQTPVSQETAAAGPQEGQLMDDTSQAVEIEPGEISDTIFRAYDIRGVVGKTLSDAVFFQLGRSIGSEAYDRGEQTVIVARDGRE